MLKKLNIIGIIIGVVIMACSSMVFSFEAEIDAAKLDKITTETIVAPEYESNKSYGGDAYTGMQQAAAQAANNMIPVFEAIEANNEAIIKLNANNIVQAKAEAENLEAVVSVIKYGVGFILLAIGLAVVSKSVEFDLAAAKKKEQV